MQDTETQDGIILQIRGVNRDVYRAMRHECVDRNARMATLLEAMWQAYEQATRAAPQPANSR